MGGFILSTRSSHGFPLGTHALRCLAFVVSAASLRQQAANHEHSSRRNRGARRRGVRRYAVPDAAEIFVDDKFLGNAPATLKLPAGPHTILLKFPGHTDWRCTLEVLKSSKTSLKPALEPAS